jgi:hypothetical protein
MIWVALTLLAIGGGAARAYSDDSSDFASGTFIMLAAALIGFACVLVYLEWTVGYFNLVGYLGSHLMIAQREKPCLIYNSLLMTVYALADLVLVLLCLLGIVFGPPLGIALVIIGVVRKAWVKKNGLLKAGSFLMLLGVGSFLLFALNLNVALLFGLTPECIMPPILPPQPFF